MEIDNIYNMDCLEGMKQIPDGSVDAVICDLPYGTTACKWDVVIPFEPLWEQYHRVCKPNAAIVLFAGEPFTSFMIMSNLGEYRQKLTWVKTRPTNVFNAKKQFMNWTEDVCVFYRSMPTFNPQMRTDGNSLGQRCSIHTTTGVQAHSARREKRLAMFTKAMAVYSSRSPCWSSATCITATSACIQRKSPLTLSPTSSAPIPTRATRCLTTVWAAAPPPSPASKRNATSSALS